MHSMRELLRNFDSASQQRRRRNPHRPHRDIPGTSVTGMQDLAARVTAPAVADQSASVVYWTTTSATVAWMGLMGVANLVKARFVLDRIEHLGYPIYFHKMLGVAKLLGAGALVLPVPRTLREWAYAGVVFELFAAAASYTAVGDGLGRRLPPIILMPIVMASYFGWRTGRNGTSIPFAATSDTESNLL